jgi:hypothetical protein
MAGIADRDARIGMSSEMLRSPSPACGQRAGVREFTKLGGTDLNRT